MHVLSNDNQDSHQICTQSLSDSIEKLELLLTSDFAAAAKLSKDVLQLAKVTDDPLLLAKAHMFAGIAYFRTADYSKASETYEQGIIVASNIGEKAIEARCLNGLGLIYYQLGDYTNAITYQLDNLKIVQELGDEEGRIRALINIGALHNQLGQKEKALDYHNEALLLSKQRNSIRYECICTINVAGYYQDSGNYAEAIKMFNETLEKAQGSQETALEGSILMNLAQAYLGAGNYKEALKTNARALPVNRASGDKENEAEALITQGRLELIQLRIDSAIEFLNQAHTIAQEIGVKRHIYEAHRYLSDCYEHKRNYYKALEHARSYHKLEYEVRSEEIERKTKFLTTKAEAEKFKHEAEIERLRNVELAALNKELEQTKEHLAYQAEHDSLTGLANRHLFERCLSNAIENAELDDSMFAVLYIDLDGFKKINDSLGHDVGDELLIQVASRLQTCVRINDLVARMGGDEFTVLIEHIQGTKTSEQIAKKILAILNSPFELAGQDAFITASIGIALYPINGKDAVSLQKNADIAMYHVKYAGKNGFKMYKKDYQKEILERA